jgi:hypothetical protein
MSVVLDAAYGSALFSTKLSMTRSVNEMATALMDKCSGCWASDNRIVPRHQAVIANCYGTHDGDWNVFKDWRSAIRLPKYTCYKCGLPSDTPSQHPLHTRGGCPEAFQDLHKQALYLIRRTPAVWAEVVANFPKYRNPKDPQLAIDMTDAQWLAWFVLMGSHFYRGLEVLVWLWVRRNP